MLFFFQVMPKCRPVLCQSGTILIDGECQHITKIVYKSNFMVTIVLVPSSNISLLQLQLKIEDFCYHLIQTWRQDWKVQKIAVSKGFSSNVNTVSVSLTYRLHGAAVSMRVLLEQIR